MVGYGDHATASLGMKRGGPTIIGYPSASPAHSTLRLIAGGSDIIIAQ
jgi:hypothetical protein